jgi:hypothetical protein
MPNQYLPGVIAIPSSLLITAMTQSSPLTVSYTVPSSGAFSYTVGQVVKLTVPRTWGMYQANGLQGKIISLGTGTMSLNIDSSLFDAFVYNPTSVESPASLSPAGSQNLSYDNSTDLVPFQSLNNIGN